MENTENTDDVTVIDKKAIRKLEEPLNDIDVARKLINISRSANKRNKEFNLGFNDVKRLLKTKTCFISGMPVVRYFIPSKTSEDLIPDDVLTIERIDNDKGYVKGNVVACSHKWNKLKSNLTVNDIATLYSALQKAKLV